MPHFSSMPMARVYLKVEMSHEYTQVRGCTPASRRTQTDTAGSTYSLPSFQNWEGWVPAPGGQGLCSWHTRHGRLVSTCMNGRSDSPGGSSGFQMTGLCSEFLKIWKASWRREGTLSDHLLPWKCLFAPEESEANTKGGAG